MQSDDVVPISPYKARELIGASSRERFRADIVSADLLKTPGRNSSAPTYIRCGNVEIHATRYTEEALAASRLVNMHALRIGRI